MSDWPKKMWMDPSGLIWNDGTEEQCTPVLVYPADQAPEPVAWIQDIDLGYLRAYGFVHAELTTGSASHRLPIYLAPPAEAADQATEQMTWVEKAIAQTWKLIDPLRPPPPGTYARGHHEGIALALSTLRDRLSNSPPSLLVLADQVEALQKDAERYRWLRDESWKADSWSVKYCVIAKRGEGLDAAIDRAREAT